MNWIWAYFRRKTMEAIVAGAHDAIAGNGSSRLSDEEAVRTLRAMFGIAEPENDPSALPGPSQPALGEPRKVGRPRKFQEPPE